MVIVEVMCREDVLNPAGAGSGTVRNMKVEAGYTYELTPHGIIVSKGRSVLIPWPNIRCCVMGPGTEVAKAGRAGAKAAPVVPA